MTRAIASLALLKTNWDHLHRDYLDSLVPFVAALTRKRQYKPVGPDDIHAICSEFQGEFGLHIPYHPMISLLDRARKRGFLVKRNGSLFPVEQKVLEADFGDDLAEIERQHENVLKEIVDYCERHFGKTINTKDAESMLIAYLKAHDLDILFASNSSSVLPDVKPTRETLFVINRFISDAYVAKPEVFRYVTNIAVGHILASALLCRDFSKFEGSLNGLNLFLDTRCIFFLLGLYGTHRKDAYLAFIHSASERGAKFFVFQQTYDELRGILEGALVWIDSPAYNPVKASDVLVHFVDHGYTSSDVERYILCVDKDLKALGVEMATSPDPDKDRQFQVDEAKLKTCIVEAYQRQNPFFNDMENEYTLQRDISAISAIYRLRRGKWPSTLKEARHLFVTTNSNLAYADRVFELQERSEKFSIPACVTDVLLGTMIWMHSPAEVTALNEKRIIAECYAATQPSKALLKKLIDEAESLRRIGGITEEDFILLRSDRVARELLAEKTLGDPDNFSSKTAAEVLNDIKKRIKAEEAQKLETEKSEHARTKESLVSVQARRQELEETIWRRADKLAGICAGAMFSVMWVVVAATAIFAAFPELSGNVFLKWSLGACSVALAIGGTMYGFNFGRCKEKVRQKIALVIHGFMIEERRDEAV